MGLFDDVSTIANSASTIDPNVAATLAQMSGGDLSSAITAAQSTEGAGSVTRWVNTLSGQDAATQNKTWIGLRPAEQQMMIAQGYKPPAQGGGAGGAGAQHRGWWGTVTHDVGRGVSDVGNALMSPIRAVQHVGRAGMALEHGVAYGTNPNQMAVMQPKLTGGPSTFNMFSPTAFQHAWTLTNDGQRSYNLADFRSIQDQFPPDVVQLAMAKAEGRENDIIATAQNPDERDAMQVRLDTDPDVARATSMLKWSQVSAGHSIIPNQVYNSNPQLANKLSGVTDAVWDLGADPTLKAGKLRQAIQVARYSWGSPEGAAHLINSRPAIQNWAAFTGNTLAKDQGSAALLRDMPHLADAIPEMQTAVNVGMKEGLSAQESVVEYLKSTAGMQAALNGRLASVPLEAGSMPRITKVGVARIGAKGTLRDAVNWAADRPVVIRGFEAGDIINEGITRAGDIVAGKAKPLTVEAAPQADAGLGDKVINAIVAPVGTQIRRTTTMITKGARLDLTKPNAAVQVQRFADTYLPQVQADQFVDAWLKGDIDTQRNLFKSMSATIADQSGGMATQEGRDFWQEFIQRMGVGDSNMISHERYAPDNIDAMPLADGEGTMVHNAIWPDQASTSWTLPSFRDMAAHASRNWVEPKTLRLRKQLPRQPVDADMETRSLVAFRIRYARRPRRIGRGSRAPGTRRTQSRCHRGPQSRVDSQSARAWCGARLCRVASHGPRRGGQRQPCG